MNSMCGTFLKFQTLESLESLALSCERELIKGASGTSLLEPHVSDPLHRLPDNCTVHAYVSIIHT